MEPSIVRSDESSLPRRTSESGGRDRSLKSRHFDLSGGIFSGNSADRLGTASADGPHHMRIKDICRILKARNSANITTALDPGAQAVPGIHFTIRDQ